MSAANNPLNKSGEPVTWNFKLLAQNDLGGFGGMGEGMSVQIAKDGRRIIWLAHESAPKNFTGVDVSDPRKPKVVVQTDLPQASHALELAGDCPATSWRSPIRRRRSGRSRPGSSCSTSRCRKSRARSRSSTARARHSRGVHQLWFCDGEYVHMASGAPDFKPSHPLDDQFYRCIDVRNPSKPVEVGRWWMPGTRATDNVAPPPRHPLDKGYRAHNTNVYPQRPDRLYLCYIDGGMFVMDITDKANPKVISHWTNSPPYTGFMHTAVPLFERDLMLVTDESTENAGKDWPKLIWILDMRDETNPVSDLDLPAAAGRRLQGPRRPLRRAQHPRERAAADRPGNPTRSCSAPSSTAACAPTTSPIRISRRKSATFVPPPPKGTPAGAVQLNDVFVDERGIVYTVDRHTGGLYMLEMDF